MRVVLVGTVLSSWHALDELLKQGLKPILVCTLKPDFANRHSDFKDLHPLAQEHDVQVLDIDNINDPEVLSYLRSLSPDYVFVFGWSQLLKKDILSLPRFGCLGLHPSLLPKNRGRALIPWTILSGVKETGVSVFYLDQGVDSGDLITQRKIRVNPDETAQSLYGKITDALREIIRTDIVPPLIRNEYLPAFPQDETLATYFAKRVPSDGWIDWQRSAQEIWTLIRATGKPYPGAFTVYGAQKVTVWDAQLQPVFNQIGVPGQILSSNEDGTVTVQCGDGWLDLRLVQVDNGSEMLAAECFKRVHTKFGLTAYDLWKRMLELSRE